MELAIITAIVLIGLIPDWTGKRKANAELNRAIDKRRKSQ
jgi:hypothetical protein